MSEGEGSEEVKCSMLLMILDIINKSSQGDGNYGGINHHMLREGIAPVAYRSSHKNCTWILKGNFLKCSDLNCRVSSLLMPLTTTFIRTIFFLINGNGAIFQFMLL